MRAAFVFRAPALLPILLIITAANDAAASTASRQFYVVCKEPGSYICRAWPLLPQFNEQVHDWVVRDMGPCALVDALPVVFSSSPNPIKTLGGGEIEIDCSALVLASMDDVKKVKRQRRQVGVAPHGRYRGQTQSQYLAIDQGGKEEGKAEAHSAADSSRASVSGNSGMGQAQSQSIYDPSCDDCYDGKNLDAASLKKGPYGVPDGRDKYGTDQYRGPGWTGSLNDTPIKNAIGSTQNVGPGLGGSGQSQPGTQTYEQHYRGPGEGTFGSGSTIDPVSNGNRRFGPNQDGSLQEAGPGKGPVTFQTDPLLIRGGSRLGPSGSGYGPNQQGGVSDPNTRDKQGNGLGPEHEGVLYNKFGLGSVGSPGSESYPPGSLMNAPAGRGFPGQDRVISTDGTPNQNSYGPGSSPSLYSPGQNNAFVTSNRPAQSGSRSLSPGSQEPTYSIGTNNGNKDPGVPDGVNQLSDPGRGYSPGNVNLGVRGTGQPSGNWPAASYTPGTSPYFCCVVGPDGNIIPAGGLPYNRRPNTNNQYPNGNKYAYKGQDINPRNTVQNVGLGLTPALKTSYGVGDPRYGVNNLGQDPGSSQYGPTSGNEKSFTLGQQGRGQIDGNFRTAPYGVNRDSSDYDIPNNYMQGPGVSDARGGYKPGSNMRPEFTGYNPNSLAERVGENNYGPGQSGVYKQGSAPGTRGNFNPGQSSLEGIGTFTSGYVQGVSDTANYKPVQGGNIYGSGPRAGYGQDDTAVHGNTGSGPNRSDGTGIADGYDRRDHTILPGSFSLNSRPHGVETGIYSPGQNTGTFGPSSTGNYPPYHLRGSYGPGLTNGNYEPGQTSGNYIPGQHTGSYMPGQSSDNYGPGQASGSYVPGQSSGSYGPGQASGSYVPSQSSGSYGPGQASGSYVPGQSSGSYGPGQGSGVYGPGQASGSYGPAQVSGSYGPGQTGGNNGPGLEVGKYIPGQSSGSYGPGQTTDINGPGQTSSGYSPGQTSGIYSPGQTSGGYGPSGNRGSYGPGSAHMGPNLSGSPGPGVSYRPGGSSFEGYEPFQNKATGDKKLSEGSNLGKYGPGEGNLGPGQNNMNGDGDYFTQPGVNSGSQGAYGPSPPGVGTYVQNQGRPGESYGSMGRPGDNGRFNVNEPFYGSDKYGGNTFENGYDPRLIGHTSYYNGIPQNFTDPNTVAEGDDSAAEASVSQATNGTTASATSRGGNDKGRAQTNVHGTYIGSGSFSAQALITGENKEAESQVTGGKKGASSSAQGSGRNNKSQANVQFGSETGSVQTQSLTNSAYHSSNSQVQGSVKGGMADAQARGPGSTSSQAQIGFTPYKNGDKTHDLQKVPFVGGGIASAQSSGRTGQSQSQLHGTFKYGITYNGAAQAGASINKDAVFPNRLSFDKIDVFDEKEKNINVVTEKPTELDISSTISTIPYLESQSLEESMDKAEDETTTESGLAAVDDTEKEDETLKNSESRYSSHTHLDHHKTNDEAVSSPVSASATRSFQPSYSNNGGEYEYTTEREDVQPDEYDTEGQEEEQGEYINYDEIPRDTLTHQSLQSPRSSLEVKQSTGGNLQHIVLGSLKNHNAEITQKNSEHPDESKTYQPGERVPGTGGYTIPIGFTGSVKSVASKEKTYVVGSKESPSQAQTVTLTPGSGRVKYSYPPPSYGRVEAGKLRSLATEPRDNRYVSVSKSVARDLDAEDNVRKQYSHSYYTKSSSCGFFTFTCTMVSGAEGKKKVCRPKIPRNPDGTPIRC